MENIRLGKEYITVLCDILLHVLSIEKNENDTFVPYSNTNNNSNSNGDDDDVK